MAIAIRFAITALAVVLTACGSDASGRPTDAAVLEGGSGPQDGDGSNNGIAQQDGSAQDGHAGAGGSQDGGKTPDGSHGLAGEGMSDTITLDATALEASPDCNLPSNWVRPTLVAQAPPTAIGGAIEDGEYRLTQVRIFTAPDANVTPWASFRQAMEISVSATDGAVMRYAWRDSGELPIPKGITAKLIWGGTSYSSAIICASRDVRVESAFMSGSYTATADQLLIIGSESADGAPVFTLARR